MHLITQPHQAAERQVVKKTQTGARLHRVPTYIKRQMVAFATRLDKK